MDPTKRRIRKIDRDAQRFVAQALGNTDLSLSDYDMIHTVRHRPGVTQEELRRLYCLDKSTLREAKVEAEAFYFRWLTAELTEAELSVLVPLLDQLQRRSRDERRQEFVHLLEEYERMFAVKGECGILPDAT